MPHFEICGALLAMLTAVTSANGSREMEADAEEQGGHAFRSWIASDHRERRQTERLLNWHYGLFERPMTVTVSKRCSRPGIQNLTESMWE